MPIEDLALEDAKGEFEDTKRKLDAAMRLGDAAAANDLSKKLDALLPVYLEAGRYRANKVSTIWAFSFTFFGLALSLWAAAEALTGHPLLLLILMPGAPALLLGAWRLSFCLSIRRRALPSPALRKTGVEGKARILEVLAGPEKVGWDSLDRSNLGKLSKWRLEVTVPGKAPYEAVVETFRGQPPNQGAFPVYVDPGDPQAMYLGETRYA